VSALDLSSVGGTDGAAHAATTFSFSRSGSAIFFNESYCRTLSASMQIKYGHLDALMPIFKASALPPFFLRIRVTLILFIFAE